MENHEHMAKMAAQVSQLQLEQGHTSTSARGARTRQELAHWPYKHSSAVLGEHEHLDPLGQVIHKSAPEERALIKHYILSEFQHKPGRPMLDDRSADYSEENPPCYTAEDCHRFATNQPGSGMKKLSDLPVYDNDMLELISAMQKQDKMILDQKEEAETRANQGEKAPPLPEVKCGNACWTTKGVWCCRME